jgi:hypothetical protein
LAIASQSICAIATGEFANNIATTLAVRYVMAARGAAKLLGLCGQSSIRWSFSEQHSVIIAGRATKLFPFNQSPLWRGPLAINSARRDPR